MVRNLLPGLLFLVSFGVVSAQDVNQYVNFEAPLHKSLAIMSVGGQSYLLACNAPDNAVEAFSTADNRGKLRIPVGMEPVTVVVRPTPNADGSVRCYSANWLGDSITAFDVFAVAGAIPVDAIVRVTRSVGDEPVGIAIVPEIPSQAETLPGGRIHHALVVTFSAPGVWGLFDPETLNPILASDGTSLGFRELLDPAQALAVKDPRAVAFAPPTSVTPNVADRLWILNFRGGNTTAATSTEPYDFDLWAADDVLAAATSQTSALPAIGGLGSTNFTMAFASNGDLYVVGQFARNHDFPPDVDPITGLGEGVVRDMVTNSTGFVTSQLYRIRGDGTVDPPRDLNLEGGLQSSLPVTQPTDLVVYGNGDPDTTRVFVTGFNSDSVGMVTVGAGTPDTWALTRIDLKLANNAFSSTNLGGEMRGPRSFALKASGIANDSADRLYVYCRLVNSVVILNPNFDPDTPPSAIVGGMKLRTDPSPAYITQGRKFLYSSKLSGGGNVSCSSCHVDGHSDFLAWNLSDGNAVSDEGFGLPDALGPNAAVKGPMVTQSLRGLVNFEVANDLVQDHFFSNRPYHFRGDRGIFEQFNGAFFNLMAISPAFFIDPANPGNNKGIDDASMTAYRRFVFSLHYPPNPNQPKSRTYSGSMWLDPANPPTDPTERSTQMNSVGIGSGAQRGLKLFHIQPSSLALSADFDADGTDDAEASCVLCHSLPDGSNNRITESFFHVNSDLDSESIESVQLRGVVQKEKRLLRMGTDGSFNFVPTGTPGAVTGEFGLIHTGKTTLTSVRNSTNPNRHGSETIGAFNQLFVTKAPPFPVSQGDIDDMTRFCREIDSGVAPVVGTTYTFDLPAFAADPVGVATALSDLENQVKAANAGLAVYARINGVLHGYFYNVGHPTRQYWEIRRNGVTPKGPFSQATLLSFIDPSVGTNFSDNSLIVQSTPLGADRRVANLNGGLPLGFPPVAPRSIVLVGALPNTANALVPLMTGSWANLVDGNFPFLFLSKLRNSASLELFQKSLVLYATTASPAGFGLDGFRHEPPRRFRVQGANIRPGAHVFLWSPTAADIATATSTTPPTTVPDKPTNQWVIDAPIYGALDALNQLVWETAVEVDAVILSFMMNGGPANANSALALSDPANAALAPIDTVDLMQPMLWNWWFVEIQNDSNNSTTLGSGGWQRIVLR